MKDQIWLEPETSLELDVKAFKARYRDQVDMKTGDMTPLRVLLLFGGSSTEHFVSCRSSENLYRALKASGHDVYLMGITMEGEFLPYFDDPENLSDGTWEARARKHSDDLKLSAYSPKAFFTAACGGIAPDVIFLGVHGVTCEDGRLQGLLELSGIPYMGSGVMASAIGMDKAMCKRLVETTGIPQLPWLEIHREQIEKDPDLIVRQIEQQLEYPCFVKPNNGGSSLGTGRADDATSLLKALRNAARFDNVVLVETFVQARELEVAVLGNDEPLISDAGEIIKNEGVEYYDYKTKYFSEDSSLAIPAPVEGHLRQRLRDAAKRVWTQIGAAGLARVDFFFDPKHEAIYFNEINTLPGFTAISLYPQAFERLGIDQPQLVNYLLVLALERHEQTKRSYRAEDDVLVQ